MQTLESQLDGVRRLIRECLYATSLGPVIPDLGKLVGSGKMLRSRLAMLIGTAAGTDHDVLEHAAASIELIHGASLLHDDVIDGASLRRGEPSFWTERGTSGAILLGDLFYCRAIGLSGNVAGGALMPVLVEKAGEMCDAESEQELLLRGKEATWEQCVSIARRKTGSLFAFVGYAAGGKDETLCRALEEAAYAVGTAYQIADDLLDVSGNDEMAGKTLGTDREREKVTAASVSPEGSAEEVIDEMLALSVGLLKPWSPVEDAWNSFLSTEIRPAVAKFTGALDVSSVA